MEQLPPEWRIDRVSSGSPLGYIVEYGGDGDPNDLSTIPEAGTLLLLGAGLAGLGLRPRKKA